MWPVSLEKPDGRHDGNVPFNHAEFVAGNVPGADLVVAESCGHFLWASPEERLVRESVDRFLRTHASKADSFDERINVD